MNQGGGFVCEGRCGSKAAENVDEHEQTSLRIEDAPRLGDITKKPDHQATQQINC